MIFPSISRFEYVVADPHRPDMNSCIIPAKPMCVAADVFVINKVDTADPQAVIAVREN